jgi:hypothetical protein
VSRLIFAIDPGTTQSGWVLFDGAKVVDSGVHDNHDLLRWVQAGQGADTIAIEMMQARGMPFSNDEMRTLVWVGRFQQAWRAPDEVRLVFRKDVKMHVCGQMKANDANVRQGLINLFPGSGGGKTPQVGTKGQPGPLYGVSSHAWPALGVAVTALAQMPKQAAPTVSAAPKQLELA